MYFDWCLFVIYWRTDISIMALLTFSLLYCIKEVDSKVAHLPYGWCATFWFKYHILMSYVVYYWTDTLQDGIYSLILHNLLFCFSGWPLLGINQLILCAISKLRNQATGWQVIVYLQKTWKKSTSLSTTQYR